MPRTIHKTEEPVVLEGYQAVMKPSKFGYSLSAVVDQEIDDAWKSVKRPAPPGGTARTQEPQAFSAKA